MVRILVGVALVTGGLFGFLPVLGFWMVPLGLVVIFFDVPWVKARWRAFRVWWKGNTNNNRETGRGRTP